jgi:hypothetical protein
MYPKTMHLEIGSANTSEAVSNSPGDFPSWGDLIWSYPGRGNFQNNDNYTIWGGGSIGPDGLGNLNTD